MTYWWAFAIVLVVLLTVWRIHKVRPSAGKWYEAGQEVRFGAMLVLGVLAIKGCQGW